MISKESAGTPNNHFHNQYLADFTDIIKDINAQINQGSNISNSNIPSHVTINGITGSITGQDANGISAKILGQVVTTMEEI